MKSVGSGLWSEEHEEPQISTVMYNKSIIPLALFSAVINSSGHSAQPDLCLVRSETTPSSLPSLIQGLFFANYSSSDLKDFLLPAPSDSTIIAKSPLAALLSFLHSIPLFSSPSEKLQGLGSLSPHFEYTHLQRYICIISSKEQWPGDKLDRNRNPEHMHLLIFFSYRICWG
jgi:hypothetical protein